MSKTLMIKAMVLGAVACAFSATGFAADVQNGHGQGIADSSTEVNGAKHEAVRSNWMDRTDIKVGTQSKMGKQISVEILQPLTHYDENSKSVLFVQGGIGKGGQERKVSYFSGVNGGAWYPLDPTTGKGKMRKDQLMTYETHKIGTVANVGLGYRHLSKNEHAYVGINAFVDRAFSENANRLSGGVEYVSGLNEVRVNMYRGLGSASIKHRSIELHDDYFNFPTDQWGSRPSVDQGGGSAGVDYYDGHKVLSGYDISYARTFKNARWTRVQLGLYHWNGHDVPTHGEYIKEPLHLGKSHGWQVGTILQITPHISLDLGYTSDSKYDSGAYGFIKYTLGTSKFAWHGGKHSDDTITNARARMLDKIERSPMMIGNTYEERWSVVPGDILP
ncbi:inverse autotransporter beta domain-containing protein [Veillonella tobetsuensis]|uniref:Inverse autotransporter beta-domain domain-containing protein n=1 Tax=Veillonella tobetsuensis TaxID=1110546 RepID=A0A480B545_9FIRM|nr:inverse autotransporter beta domain-containing protein [Veillonella tobetsuensis]GCL66965.1 hypothetical protein PAGU1578_05860 [Veillonella tobetsuensis]